MENEQPTEVNLPNLMKKTKVELTTIFHSLCGEEEPPPTERMTKKDIAEFILQLVDEAPAVEAEHVPTPEIYYRVNKISRGEWSLIRLRDGVETVVVRDLPQIVLSKLTLIIQSELIG